MSSWYGNLRLFHEAQKAEHFITTSASGMSLSSAPGFCGNKDQGTPTVKVYNSNSSECLLLRDIPPPT